MAERGSAGLFRMLADLSENPEMLSRFKNEKTRSSLLDEYDLTDEQKDLLHKAIDENRHEHERYGHMTKLVGDEAAAKLIPLC